MSNDPPLLPPVPVIYERLTRNQRERRLLRTLLRLALRDTEDSRRPEARDTHPDANRKVVSQ